jgi:DNA mismatch endonuclease, patch repair protein
VSNPVSKPSRRAPRGRADQIVADPAVAAVGSAATSWATSPAIRRSMQANRRRDTHPELAIRRLIHARGLRYRVDARALPTARYTADMIFPRARVAVFIDGCWWHGCADHYRPPASNAAYWSGKVARNRERDRLADETLAAAEWTVVRVWEHEAPEVAARRIEAVVRSHSAPATTVSHVPPPDPELSDTPLAARGHGVERIFSHRKSG